MATIQEQIDWCKELHDSHIEWLKLIDDDVQKTSIEHSKREIETLSQIIENLETMRLDKAGITEIFKRLEEEEARHKGVTVYLNADAGRWHLVPYLNVTIDSIGDIRRVLSVEVGWLKRWYAIEIDLKPITK